MKLHGELGNFRANKVLTVATFTGKDVQQLPVDPKNQKISPLRKFPVLEVEGTTILDSNAMVRFLAQGDASYHGSPMDLAKIDTMIDLGTDLELAVNSWIAPILGKADYDSKTVNMAIQEVKAILGYLDKALAAGEFLCGVKLTLADFVVFNALVAPYRMVFDAKFMNSYKNLKRWFDAFKTRAEIVRVWGKIHECRTVQPFPKPSAKAVVKLHGELGNFRANKVLTVAALTGKDVEQLPFDPKNKNNQKISPLRKFPVLEVEGTTILETNAICRFLARDTTAYQGSPIDLCNIDNMIDLSSAELEPAVNSWIAPILGKADYDSKTVNMAIQETKAILAYLDKALEAGEFLCGASLTLADFVVFNALVFPYRMVFDAKFMNSYKNLKRWFEALKTREEIVGVWGKIFECRTVQPFPEPKAKPEKKAPAPKKAAAPKKEETKAEEDKPAKKPVNPLDLLPETPLILDEWKKLYSNNPVEETLPAFWKMFDKAGWSIWKVDYEKIEGECEKVYMTNNMLNGFLQRMEAMRKYSFGYLGIYGDEPDLNIRGVFFWRGLTVPQEMIDHPQFEYYKREQLDSENPEHRAIVEEFWGKTTLEQSVVQGAKLQNGKCWK